MLSTRVLEGSEKNLKIININVDEQSTGEISAGAGIDFQEEQWHLTLRKIIG